MLHSAGDAADLLKHGQSFLGPGWREAQSFDDVSDPEDYSDTEAVRPSQLKGQVEKLTR